LIPRKQLAAGQLFIPGTPVSSTNKTDRHDITEILLTVALSTIPPRDIKHFIGMPTVCGKIRTPSIINILSIKTSSTLMILVSEGDFVDRIYHNEVEIKDTTDTDSSAAYLDLQLENYSEGRLRTKLYDKKYDSNFSC
jgi:hypothetical protein